MLARVSFWAQDGSQPIKVEAETTDEGFGRVSITIGADVHLLLSQEEARVLYTELSTTLWGTKVAS